MQRLVTGDQWGLAAKGIAAKGGWGPGVHGGYLVRQFGIVPTPSGNGAWRWPRTRMTASSNGVDVVNAMTDWLVSRLPSLARY